MTRAVASDALDEAELLDGVARDRGGDPVRAGLDLDQRDHPVDLDRGDDAGEAVAGRERVAGPVALRRGRAGARPRRRDAAAVARVARRLELAVAVPAAQRVDADADGAGRVAQGQIRRFRHLPKHYIGSAEGDARGGAAGPGSAPRPGRSEELVDEHLAGALELGDRRRLDAADAGLGVDPHVGLAVAAAALAGELGDQPMTLGPQVLAPLEGGDGRRLARRPGVARRSPRAGEGRAGPRPRRARRRGSSAGRRRRRRGRNRARRPARSSRRSSRSSQVPSSISRSRRANRCSSSSIFAAWARSTGSAGRKSQLSFPLPLPVRTKRPTIWRKIIGVLAVVA